MCRGLLCISDLPHFFWKPLVLWAGGTFNGSEISVLFISIGCEEVAHELHMRLDTILFLPYSSTHLPSPSPMLGMTLVAPSRHFPYMWLRRSQCLLTLTYILNSLMGKPCPSETSLLMLPCVYSGQSFALFYLAPATRCHLSKARFLPLKSFLYSGERICSKWAF